MGKNSGKSPKEGGKESREKKAKKNISKENSIANILKNLSAELLRRSEDTSEGKWVDLESERPSPRAHSSFTQIDNGRVVVFGGEFFDGFEVTLYNDTFLFDLNKHTWKVLDTPSSLLPRCSHQALYHKNRIYVFGGEFNTADQFHHFNDVNFLCLSTLRWNNLKVQGTPPTPRSGHRMVLWKDYWVMFGGFHDNGKESTYFNDLFYFDLAASKWHKVGQKFQSSLPEARAGCLLLPLNDQKNLIMHGGFSKKDSSKNVTPITHTDTWLIDMNCVLLNNDNVLVWTKVQTSQSTFFSTGLGYAKNADFALVFGGVKDVDQGLSVKSTFSNQAFKLNLSQRKYNPVEMKVAGASDQAGDADDFENLGSLSLGKTAPTPRMNSNVALHGNYFYVFGGIVEVKNAEITLSDVWKLNLSTNEWSCVDEGFKNMELYSSQLEDSESESEEMGDDLEDEDEDMEEDLTESEDLEEEDEE